MILWPVCKERSGGDLYLARKIFAWHANHDGAWLRLGAAEIARRINELG
jgi:hypothetical protein